VKKFLVAILALVYLSSSAGATLHLHYCMGKLADWGLGQSHSKTCGGCGMEKKDEKDKGCCKDELKFIKNTTDQKTPEATLLLFQSFSVALPVTFFEIPGNKYSSVTEDYPISHAPPLIEDIPVYLRNCVFLI
jgi:hypothetical protein